MLYVQTGCEFQLLVSPMREVALLADRGAARGVSTRDFQEAANGEAAGISCLPARLPEALAIEMPFATCRPALAPGPGPRPASG